MRETESVKSKRDRNKDRDRYTHIHTFFSKRVKYTQREIASHLADY